MNRVLTGLAMGAMALSLQSAAVWAQDETPAAESKPITLAEADPAEYVDLLAEDKDGNVLGAVFDVVVNDSGKATTIVLELFEEEAGGEAAENEEAASDEEIAAQDTVEEEPEPLADEDAEADEGEATEGEAAEAEGTEEPMVVGKLVGVSPKGAMLDTGRDVITLPSVTAAQVQGMSEFTYKAGMKTVSYPDGYKEE